MIYPLFNSTSLKSRKVQKKSATRICELVNFAHYQIQALRRNVPKLGHCIKIVIVNEI